MGNPFSKEKASAPELEASPSKRKKAETVPDHVEKDAAAAAAVFEEEEAEEKPPASKSKKEKRKISKAIPPAQQRKRKQEIPNKVASDSEIPEFDDSAKDENDREVGRDKTVADADDGEEETNTVVQDQQEKKRRGAGYGPLHIAPPGTLKPSNGTSVCVRMCMSRCSLIFCVSICSCFGFVLFPQRIDHMFLSSRFPFPA